MCFHACVCGPDCITPMPLLLMKLPGEDEGRCAFAARAVQPTLPPQANDGEVRVCVIVCMLGICLPIFSTSILHKEITFSL